MIDDIDRVMAVMEAAFDPAYGEAWTRRQIEDALTFPGTHLLLADAGGAMPAEGAAAAGFALSRGAADEEELLLLAVHPQWRGKGVGGALLARFVEAARARGAKRLFLEMRDGNEAQSLYRRSGFHEIGRRREYYTRGTGKPIDAITLALSIS